MDSPIIDLVILLTFTYFTSSLILSSINEGISQGIFHLREKNLKKAIEVLFISKDWKMFIKTDFEKSAHIQSLMKKQGKYPTYIPANSFFLFVIEKIGSTNYQEGRLQVAIQEAMIPQEFKKVLLDIAAKGNNKLEAFEKNLNQFYDDALEHSSVWYRKKIRRILLAMGLILAVTMNIDTIMISNDALTNTKDLGKTVDKIIEQMPNIDVGKDTTTTITIRNNNGQVMVSQKINPGKSFPTGAVADSSSVSNNIDKVRVMYEETTGYYLGYKKGEFMHQWFGRGFTGFLVKLLGVLITAFAVQLGSNYWFDIMKKAVSMRTPMKKGSEGTAISQK
jgi:hypothetical protein